MMIAFRRRIQTGYGSFLGNQMTGEAERNQGLVRFADVGGKPLGRRPAFTRVNPNPLQVTHHDVDDFLWRQRAGEVLVQCQVRGGERCGHFRPLHRHCRPDTPLHERLDGNHDIPRVDAPFAEQRSREPQILRRIRGPSFQQNALARCPEALGDVGEHFRFALFPTGLQEVASMRYTTGEYQRRSVSTLIEVRGKLRYAQIIGPKRDDDVGWNRMMPQLVVLPDDSRRAKSLFSHSSYSVVWLAAQARMGTSL